MMKVYVNPNYRGQGWFDPKSAINFTKRNGVITVPDGANRTNIDRYLNFNYLIEVKEEQAVEVKNTVVQTPNQLLSEDIKPIETVAEVVVEAIETVVETPAEVVEAAVEVVEAPVEEPKIEEKKTTPKKGSTKKKQ